MTPWLPEWSHFTLSLSQNIKLYWFPCHNYVRICPVFSHNLHYKFLCKISSYYSVNICVLWSSDFVLKLFNFYLFILELLLLFVTLYITQMPIISPNQHFLSSSLLLLQNHTVSFFWKCLRAILQRCKGSKMKITISCSKLAFYSVVCS